MAPRGLRPDKRGGGNNDGGNSHHTPNKGEEKTSTTTTTTTTPTYEKKTSTESTTGEHDSSTNSNTSETSSNSNTSSVTPQSYDGDNSASESYSRSDQTTGQQSTDQGSDDDSGDQKEPKKRTGGDSTGDDETDGHQNGKNRGNGNKDQQDEGDSGQDDQGDSNSSPIDDVIEIAEDLWEAGKWLADKWDEATNPYHGREEEVGKAEERLHSTGPVNKSDELLDDAKMGLDFFRDFIPLYRDWTGGGPLYETDVLDVYNQLRGIDFAAFREDADRLGAVHQALTEQTDEMKHAFRTARQTWQGEAAEAADAKVEGFTEAGTTVCAETEDFAGAISPAMDGIQQVVREYASFVLELGKEMKCAGKTPQETQDEIRKARGDLEFSDLADVGIDDLFSGAWAAFKEHGISLILGMTFKVPSWLEPGVKEACDTIRNRLIEEAKAWLDTSFKPEFDAKFSQFQQQSQSTQQQVQEIYDKLLGTQISESPFDPPAEKPPAEKPPAETTPSSTNQPSANDRGGGDIGGGGNDTGGGGISPPDSGGMPEGGIEPPPEASEPPDLPQDGESEADTEEQSVTLGEGEKAVTIHKPEQDGKVEVELLGEDGKPKKYLLDFGDGSGEGTAAPLGQSAAGQAGQQVPGQPGQQIPGQPADPGAVGGVPGADEDVIPVQAGEDGKIVIEEGDRTLVFERTPEGDIKVTVDNGDGLPPVKETVSFGGGEDSAFGDLGRSEFGAPGADGAVGGPGVGPGAVGAEAGLGMPGPEAAVGEPGIGPGGVGAGPGVGVPGQVGAEGAVGMADSPAGAGAAGFTGGAGGFAGGAAAAGGDPLGAVGADGAQAASVSPQSSGFTTFSSESSAHSFGSASGQLFGGSGEDSAPGGADEQRAPGGTAGIGSMGQAQVGSPAGATGLGSMQDAGAGTPAGGQAGQGGMMGGMMGMGGMGHAGQQGGDQERSNPSPWRTQGDLFDDGITGANYRFRSVLGEDQGRV